MPTKHRYHWLTEPSSRLIPFHIITSPKEAADYLRSVWDDDTLDLREEFLVILPTRPGIAWGTAGSIREEAHQQ